MGSMALSSSPVLANLDPPEEVLNLDPALPPFLTFVSPLFFPFHLSVGC